MSYDNFAHTFSNSRKKHPWPELDYIIDDIKTQGLENILDIGCGNGRFLEEAQGTGLTIEEYLGIDNSQGMIEEARKLHPDYRFEVLDMLEISREGLCRETLLTEGGRGESGLFDPVRYSEYSHRLGYNTVNTTRAKELRKNMTNAEKILWYQILRNQDPRWHRQYPIDNYIVDFYCPKMKLIVEIDGDSHVLDQRNINYDQQRTKILEQYGLSVLRFTNTDVYEGLERVAEIINSPLPPSTKGVDSHFILDIPHLSLLSSKFDAIVLLASFHHLKSQDERIAVLQNLRSLLTLGGRVYMTNWNLLDQEKYKKSHQGDGDYGIKIGAHSRYYHGFTTDELQSLFQETGWNIVENRVFDGGRNIFSILA